MINLSVGNPSFLAPYWNTVKLEPFSQTNSYQRECGNAELKASIYEYHRLIDNVPNLRSYELVVGHGATQVMQAALASSPLRNGGVVYAHAPHYPKFEFFAKQAALPFTDTPHLTLGRPVTEIVTYPTNPDNRTDIPTLVDSYKIYDCSYLWPQYTNAAISGHESILVFSLAKATGHASARIGWALVKSASTASLMRDFIEHQSGDVSLPSQEVASQVLDHENELLRQKKGGVAHYGASVLDARWKTIRELTKPFNTSGMFLWMDGMLPPEIKGMNGIYFGVDRRFNRYNLGCSEDEFNAMIDIIKNSR